MQNIEELKSLQIVSVQVFTNHVEKSPVEITVSFFQECPCGFHHIDLVAGDDLVLGYFLSLLECCSTSFCTSGHRLFHRPIAGMKAKTMTRYAYFILIPAFVFNVISQSSVPLSMTLTMVGYSVLTHIMVAIGAVIVGKILGRSRDVITAFVLISIFGNVANFGLSLLDF
ncbi:MAG: hypothetical protein P8O70_02180 [SAR324 cluster bacterium]|nr:hypothetical protein [SAR324 cluster bacterium]